MRNIVIDTIRSITSIPWGRRITVLLVAANIALPILYVTGMSSRVFGNFDPQNRKRVENRSSSDVPVELIEIKVKEKAVLLKQDFEGEVYWLKDLKFKIKNRSEKPVTWIGINLIFPETRATGLVMLHQLFIGQRSDMPSTLTSNPPLDLKPGEEKEISLEPEFDQIRRLIKLRGRVEDINDVELTIDEVMFADDTLYSGSNMWRRNPDTSSARKWLKISPGR